MLSEFYDKLISAAKADLVRRHTEGNYSVWCYHKSVYYNQKWDEFTSQVRGIVTYDPDGLIVARPMTKMQNKKDNVYWEPNKKLNVSEKIDGTLIVIWEHQGQLRFSTKFGLSNEYIDKARIVWEMEDRPKSLNGYTLMCELTHTSPEIMVKPKESDQLYLIGMRDTDSGKELLSEDLDIRADMYKLKRPDCTTCTWKELLKRAKEEEDIEGWVAEEVSEEGQDVIKTKIKTSWYLRKQKIANSLTPRLIMGLWSEGEIGNIVHLIDDQPWIQELIDSLNEKETKLFNEVFKIYSTHAGYSKRELIDALSPIRSTYHFHIVLKCWEDPKPYARMKTEVARAVVKLHKE